MRRLLFIYLLHPGIWPSKMSTLQQLRVFVNERLAAAAEEIFVAVERTIIEYHNDIYLSKEDKHSAVLTLAGHSEAFTAASQEVSTSEAEAFTQPSHTEYCQVLVKQETSGPGFPEPLEHGPSQDEGKPQDLSEGDACLKYGPSTESSSSCQSQNVASGERDLLPGTSAGWIKTEEDADGYAASDFLQPLSSESGDGGDTSDPSLHIKKQTHQRPLCGESFHHRSSLIMGVKSHAHDTDHAMSALLETHMENNLCLICGKTFSRRSNLKRHMLIHTCQKPHCCKECGKRFTRVESLRIHTRIHTVERPYACDVCGKGFRQRSNMLFHLRTHTGRNPHRCGVCPMLFARKKDVIRHMQVHAKKT